MSELAPEPTYRPPEQPAPSASPATPQEATSLSALLSRPVPWLAVLDWEKVIYIAFILIALVTRLWGVGDRVMSHDESLHTQFSYNFYNGDGFRHTPLMHGPFLFHITALSYWLFGANDFTSRLPVALFGVLLVVIPYFLRNWLGRVGAIVTSFLFLISPFITYYSRYIRHDIYVIVWALIVFIATWYYLRERKEKYIWWFAAGLALMFSTKEVSFIYVAIFGSFLIIRLLVHILQAPWLRKVLPTLLIPVIVFAVGLLVLGGGVLGVNSATSAEAPAGTATATAEDNQGFAADPNAEAEIATAEEGSSFLSLMRWLQVAGILGVSLALFLVARQMRPYIDDFPEFDLIILYTTLILPTISPVLTTIAGYNPQDYSYNRVEVVDLQTFFAQLSVIPSSPLARTSFFLALSILVAVLVGLWWNKRRWLIAAVIFNSIFIILYTSVFTNPSGWGSGMIGSLAYWLEQQEVQRGNQPDFYYFFIVPFYEFLPLIFALLAIGFWTVRQRINGVVGYWIGVILLCRLAYRFGNWLGYRPEVLAGGERGYLIGAIAALFIFIVALILWMGFLARRIRQQYDLSRGWRGWLELFDPQEMVGFIPQLIWWWLLTWVAYSVAGEKMPWLSTHFVIPMAMLAGWYLNERLRSISPGVLFSRRNLIYLGIVVVTILALFLLIQPLFLGEVRLGDQEADNLRGLGRLLGSFLVVAGLFYLLRRFRGSLTKNMVRVSWMMGFFIILSLLTIRFTYMASFPNADYAREFMVYAHAAPAVKETVIPRIEELSLRLNGDLSMQVAWDDDSTWPIQWYLKDFPNRTYYGKNPSASVTDAPVVIAGSLNWNNVEPVLGDDYEAFTYTFLWWPLEDYRRISWNAIFGVDDWAQTPETPYPENRGLDSPAVRRALWDIFFHRDFTQFGQVFGKEQQVTPGQWDLRHDLRLYIRKDVLASLWDYGVNAAAIEPPVDPYAAGEVEFAPDIVIQETGTGEGQLQSPRNLAIGPEGNLYVADSGNHRIQVFTPEGQFLRAWGTFGSEPGQFNEPWGLAVDEEFVYVADTWNHRVQKFTLEGDLVTTIGASGNVVEMGIDSGGFFFGPRDVLLLSADRLAVTDTGNHRIQIFDREGNFLSQFGTQGGLQGQFSEPVGLGKTAAENIYVVDTWNKRIQRFTPVLAPELMWEVDGWEGNSTNNKPYLAVDSTGRVYVTDPENYRVLVFSGEGQYLARFGRFSAQIDGFGLPNGIVIDAEDNIWVADAGNSRLLRFPPLTAGGPPAVMENEGMDEAEVNNPSPTP
jgi:predicted membrane-bound mannosyltransferase/DNA-binding beta-propeller fold protein YncE